MKKNRTQVLALLFAVLIMALSIWGPEVLSRYRDRGILEKIHAQAAKTEGEGYRYSLNSSEKLFILSKCLNSQTLPESEQNALSRGEESLDGGYQKGAYAFVVNHRGPSGKEITDQEIFETCGQGLDGLKKLGILPDSVKAVTASDYSAVLYSAIDVLEPRNNVSVWKISLSTIQKNANKENRLIDVYVDGDDGKIYEFYARTELEWKDMDPDEVMEQWSGYLGLPSPVPYEIDNPLMETTPYFKKYVFPGIGEERTIATIGFYEGINEIFIKVSK